MGTALSPLRSGDSARRFERGSAVAESVRVGALRSAQPGGPVWAMWRPGCDRLLRQGRICLPSPVGRTGCGMEGWRMQWYQRRELRDPEARRWRHGGGPIDRAREKARALPSDKDCTV
jgi:hypothetical protein